jgi:hypothetical protein
MVEFSQLADMSNIAQCDMRGIALIKDAHFILTLDYD